MNYTFSCKHYIVEFDADDDLLIEDLTLNFGHVKEFATVILNKEDIGTRLWRPFRYKVPKDLLLKGTNVLEIKVTNSLAKEFEKHWLPSGLSEEIKLIVNED